MLSLNIQCYIDEDGSIVNIQIILEIVLTSLEEATFIWLYKFLEGLNYFMYINIPVHSFCPVIQKHIFIISAQNFFSVFVVVWFILF